MNRGFRVARNISSLFNDDDDDDDAEVNKSPPHDRDFTQFTEFQSLLSFPSSE